MKSAPTPSDDMITDLDADDAPEVATEARPAHVRVRLAVSANPRSLPAVEVDGKIRKSVRLRRGVTMCIDARYLEAVKSHFTWPGFLEPYLTIEGPFFDDEKPALNGQAFPTDLRQVSSPEKWIGACRDVELLKQWAKSPGSLQLGTLCTMRTKQLLSGVECSVDPFVFGRQISHRSLLDAQLDRDEPEAYGRAEASVWHLAPKDHEGRALAANPI